MKYIIAIILVCSYVQALHTSCNKLDASKFTPLHKPEDLVYSGYLDVNDSTESVLAFLFYGHQSAKTVEELKNYPTMIYLNGLISETSQIGNFLEIGPIRINLNGEMEKNLNTWNSKFNLLFVDLEIGTGYSYHEFPADIPINADQISSQFLHALEQFLKADNGCVKKHSFTGIENSNWYIFGEGYAAKQIIHIATKILDSQSSSLHNSLKGIGLGNGYIDADSLLREIPSYAFNLGLVEPRERGQLERLALTGLKQLEKGDYMGVHNSVQKAITMLLMFSGGINIQNIDQFQLLDDHFKKLYGILNLESTKTNLQFDTSIPFKYVSSEIFNVQASDFAKPDALLKLKELQSKIKILVYNGQNDVLCPIPSALRYLSKINDDFKTKQLNVLEINKRQAGYTLKSNQITFVTINNAGYYIPLEKGDVILSIVESWI